MPSLSASAAQLRQLVKEVAQETRRAAAAGTKRAITPKFLEDKVEGSTRAGQVTAAFFLPFIVTVSLVIVRVINNLMVDVLNAGTISGEQFSITAFLVTFLTLGVLVFCAWGWFQFVRTGGFGAFVQ